VNPLIAFAVLLGAAFVMPLIERLGTRVARTLFFLALAFLVFTAAALLLNQIRGGTVLETATAGFAPPMSINLRAGLPETILWTAFAVVLFIGGLYLVRRDGDGMHDRMLYLIVALGAGGLLLTRDLFNVFVFLEITSLGLYGLIGRGGDRSLQAGFKYMVAGGMASIMFLIGTIFLYRLTGTLNIDGMVDAAGSGVLDGFAGTAAVFFLALAFVIELKPFPANGWALDAYEEAPAGIGALMSAVQASAVFIAFTKIGPLLSPGLMSVVGGVGMVTFVFANLLGLRQRGDKRMLGYSSTGQMGLLLFAWSVDPDAALVIGGLLLTHLFAKPALFWIVGTAGRMPAQARTGRFARPVTAAAAGIAVMALLGLPPFPSFFAKWALIRTLQIEGSWWALAALVLGSLFEAGYLFSWLVRNFKSDPSGSADTVNGDSLVVGREPGGRPAAEAAVAAAGSPIAGAALWGLVPALSLTGLAALWAWFAGVLTPEVTAPFAAAIVMALLAFLPSRVRGLLSVAAVGAAAWWVAGRTEGLDRIFGLLFLAGGAVNLFGALARRDRRIGFWSFATMTTLALGSLVLADSPLALFIAWEVMSVGMVLVVLQGRRASGPARSGLLFALGGGFLLMIVLISGLAGSSLPPILAIVLTAVALLAKSGSLGLHIWLPGSYAEADDDASGLLSAVVGKAAIWAMFLFSLRILPELLGLESLEGWIAAFSAGPLRSLAGLLGWIGALTALGATLVAVFQEDIKYTLAWSSIGQVGYIILAFSLFDHLGWTTAVYLSINHFIFKSMLFLAAAGVILRTRTRLMYRMGGLIRPMPISFLSVLMAIIALSGVPPLSGFGGKWLVYTSLIQGGRPLQAAAAMFASGVAFLYLFRLIHSVFLGQRKDESLEAREAPFWLVLPQLVLMAALMLISSFPRTVLDPVMAAVARWDPGTTVFEGSTLVSALGYWNGSWVMYVTMGVFLVPLLMLLIGMRNVRRVGQFNIVFAAERPDRPETTHYAHNFFAPYRKALGFLLKPAGRRFWEGTASGIQAVGSAVRRLYTGNGQTYALHIVLFTMIVALFAGVFA